jgi:succinyl-CoA synthetase beta subunit
MDIYEYQAKKIFRDFGVSVPYGLIAYTPNEAKEAALKVSHDGPWVVKAQILAGSRDVGKFSDKRAGRRGGIRLSKTIDEVYENADEMLENMLVTNQTGAKGRLVSRVYIEEYIKTIRKYYLGFIIDRITASVILLLTPVAAHMSDDILYMSLQTPNDILKVNLGLQKELSSEQLSSVINFMEYKGKRNHIKSFLNKLLNIFYH